MDNGSFQIEYVGGPLDGPGYAHPTMNWILNVKDSPEGSYIYDAASGNYVWVTK